MKLSLNKFYYFFSIATLILLLFSATFPVAAHKVILYAYVEGDKIIAEGGFGDGSIAKNAEVKVYDSQENLLTEGTTDNNGIYEFKIPAKTDLKIVLNAGMGHQAEYIVTEDELPDLSNGNIENKEINNKQAKKIASIDQEKLRVMISQELDKKIAPLNKKLVQIENNKGPGVTEIIGGIGYIFGLMGLALYFTKGRS